MKISTIFKALTVAAAATALSGCKSDLLDTVPTNSIATENTWKKASLANQAVIGIYNEFTVRFCRPDGNNWTQPYDTYSSVMDIDMNWKSHLRICDASATPSSSDFASDFKYYYTIVFRANDVISHIDQVPDMTDEEKSCRKSEAKFLRAYAYMYLNVLWRGVPLYLEYISDTGAANQPRNTEQEVWNAVLKDLTDCIEDPDLPDKYAKGDGNYGRVTKGAAYAYRGQAYQFLNQWENALSDFEKVGQLGYSLYTGSGALSFQKLLKPENEQCDEMIFAVQCVEMSGRGNPRATNYGTRVTGVTSGAWNNYLPNPAYVESFENADGSKFVWEDYLPGWNAMTPPQRSVFFLRDGMSDAEKTKMSEYGADMSKYLDYGNEDRIKKAYSDRDPRMNMAIITPYSTYFGAQSGNEHTYTLRWPYRSDTDPRYYDIRTDTNSKFYYLWRKYVSEGNECTTRWIYEEDLILCRYAEILLRQAECLNELGRTSEAVDLVNKVRQRAGQIALNSNAGTTVKDQADMRQRIRNEFYWELGGEDSMYFNELRWGTWMDKKFRNNTADGGERGTNGLMQIWGETTYRYTFLGDYVVRWPFPAKEMEMNAHLVQNEGWNN